MSDEFNFDFDFEDENLQQSVQQSEQNYPKDSYKEPIVDDDTSELASILYNIINNHISIYPFPHGNIPKVFEENTIKEMQKNIPDSNYFTTLEGDDHQSFINLKDIKDIGDKTEYWKTVASNLCNGALKGFILQTYYQTLSPEIASDSLNIVKEKVGYELKASQNKFPDNHLLTIKIPLDDRGYDIDLYHANDEIDNQGNPITRLIKIKNLLNELNTGFLFIQHPQLCYSVPKRTEEKLYLNYTIFTSKSDYMTNMDKSKNEVGVEDIDDFIQEDTGY